MITRTFTLPARDGTDPSALVTLLFGEEYVLTAAVGHYSKPLTTTVPFEALGCEMCNGTVALHEPCVVTDNLLYCWSCALKWVIPYLDS